MLKKIIYEDDLPVKVEIISVSSYPLHLHQDIQLIYILEGQVDLRLTFKTYRLRKNDFRYIHSEDIHAMSSPGGNNSVLVLSVNTGYIERFYPNIRTAVITMPTDKTLLLYDNQQSHLKYCIFILLDEFLKRSEGFAARIKNTLKTIFGIIYREFRSFTIDRENKAFVYKRLQDIRQTERLGEIIDDIYRNYVEPSTLEEIASRQDLNPYYLSHLFSQTIGINYRDFINMVRVETSEYELLSSDLSVSHIALSSGFSNSSYYSKHFRFWFGMTPQEYREKYAGQTLQNSEPLMVSCELADYSDMIQENLRELAAAFSDAHAEPLSQTIHVDNADFDDSFRLRLNLIFRNPDLAAEEAEETGPRDEMLEEAGEAAGPKNHWETGELAAICTGSGTPEKLFSPLFINSRFDSVKLIIEIFPERNPPSCTDMYLCVKSLLDSLVVRHCCDFNVGMAAEADAAFGSALTADGIRTPLYHLMTFLTQDHDAICVDNRCIIMRKGDARHILCWNMNPDHAAEVTLKARASSESLVTVSRMELENYHGYLSAVRKIKSAGIEKKTPAKAAGGREKSLSERIGGRETLQQTNTPKGDCVLPETALRAAEHLLFSEESCFRTGKDLSITVQLRRKSLAFVSIIR